MHATEIVFRTCFRKVEVLHCEALWDRLTCELPIDLAVETAFDTWMSSIITDRGFTSA